jgi:hypothetical protein
LRKLALAEGFVSQDFLKGLEPVNNFLQDLCRRTMFQKVKEGLMGTHTMPCWRKYTISKG